MTDDPLVQAVGAAAIGFGVAGLLAPRLLAKAFGFRTDTGELEYLMRIAAVEDFGVGINLLLARTEDCTRPLAIAGAVDATCCLLALAAGRSGALTRRSVAMMAGTTAGVAVTAAMATLRARQSLASPNGPHPWRR